MLDLILKFSSACRASGLRVSTSEVIDCVRQLELIELFDEAQFRADAVAVRATAHIEPLVRQGGDDALIPDIAAGHELALVVDQVGEFAALKDKGVF